MKIVFLSRYQNKVERGAEIFVNELSKRLATNHIVDILAGEDADSISKVLSGKYDIVIPVNGRSQSLKMSMFRLVGGYKLLITGHSGKGWDDIWNIAVAKPDIFVALTETMYQWAKNWAWGSKVIKIPNGVDLNKFKPQGKRKEFDLKPPVILSVGALVWYKCHERTIKALSLLSQGSLLLVGDGPLKTELLNLGNKLLSDRFKIIQADYEDLPEIYRGANLFVLPSWEREAFGIVYIEAMASGLGVVAPNDPVRNEIIGEAGILADVSDPQSYAKVIEQALNLNWKAKAINQARKFSWEKVAREYEKAFMKL